MREARGTRAQAHGDAAKDGVGHSPCSLLAVRVCAKMPKGAVQSTGHTQIVRVLDAQRACGPPARVGGRRGCHPLGMCVSACANSR